MRPVPVLAVDAAPGVLRYRLDVPERDLGEPLQEELRHAVDDATMQALLLSADDLLRSPGGPGFARAARERGAVLYRTLVPPRLRERLKALRGPLLVSTSLYGLPWELLHDGEEFWGLRYALGKRLVMDRPLPPPAGARRGARLRALVVGADPRGDLPFVPYEVETVCAALEGVADVDCLSGRVATFEAVSAQLARGFDLVHYCGHVVPGERSGPALLLADGQPLAAAAIEANLAGRPLVFLNGCASARGDTRRPTGAWETTLSNLAYGFLFGGAVGVVGTLCDVSDRHAALLAEEFWRRALAGTPVGEALRAARARCRDDAEAGASPAWLSFVLHGSPAQVLRGEAAAPPAAAPAVAPAARPRRRRLVAVAALVLVAVAILAAGLARRRPPAPAAPVVVGVMEVRARGAAVPAWMRELTRDGLNTILSKFHPIRVYSRQKIDFLRERRGLGEIEAAEALGMSKMLSATVSRAGALVTLDLEIVDIASGLLEASERVQGPEERFMELQADLALRALRVLGVTPSPEEVSAVLADRGPETLEAYRLFTDTLGDPAPPPAPPPAEAPPAPRTSWLAWPGLAYAEEPGAEEQAIHALLERYAASLRAKSVEDLAALQLEMSERQRAALRRYFGNAQALEVRILDVDVLVEGDEAIATFTREDVFVDVGSGRRMRVEVRVSGLLAKHEGVWRIRGLRTPS